MSTPQDPGRPEDRPAEPSGYPDAPPPPDPAQYQQGPGQAGQQGYPPDPAQYQQGPGQAGQQGYPPDPAQYQQGPGQAGYQGYPPPPDYGSQQQQPYAGGPAGPGSSYGNAPAYPGGAAPGFGTPPGRPDIAPPTEVLRAVQLMFVRVAIGIIGAIVSLSSAAAIKDAIRQGNPRLTATEVDNAYRASVIVAIVLAVIIGVLFVLLALQVRKGKHWARVVTWVLAGLDVLSGLAALFGTGTALEKVVAVIGLLIDVGIIALLAMRRSNQYFAAMRQPRY